MMERRITRVAAALSLIFAGPAQAAPLADMAFMPEWETGLVVAANRIALNGTSSAPKPPVLLTSPEEPWPEQVFAPYIDATAWPPLDFMTVARELGVRFFHLSFVVAESATRAEPSWGGYLDATQPYRPVDVEALRATGGDIAIVFGGAIGTELAIAARSVEELARAYRAVINANGVRVIDFDIEGAWLAHPDSITRRSQALALLQRSFEDEDRPLDIWLTLPTTPNGLTADGVNVIRSALTHGVVLSGVNIMAMNYGNQVAPNPQGRMGTYAIEAARNLHRQLHTLLNEHGTAKSAAEIWHMIGITPMIGMNDVVAEVFDQSDAGQLMTFARETQPRLLSFWSLNRDRPCEPPLATVSPGCSSTPQRTYEFTRIFQTATAKNGK